MLAARDLNFADCAIHKLARPICDWLGQNGQMLRFTNFLANLRLSYGNHRLPLAERAKARKTLYLLLLLQLEETEVLVGCVRRDARCSLEFEVDEVVGGNAAQCHEDEHGNRGDDVAAQVLFIAYIFIA